MSTLGHGFLLQENVSCPEVASASVKEADPQDRSTYSTSSSVQHGRDTCNARLSSCLVCKPSVSFCAKRGTDRSRTVPLLTYAHGHRKVGSSSSDRAVPNLANSVTMAAKDESPGLQFRN